MRQRPHTECNEWMNEWGKSDGGNEQEAARKEEKEEGEQAAVEGRRRRPETQDEKNQSQW